MGLRRSAFACARCGEHLAVKDRLCAICLQQNERIHTSTVYAEQNERVERHRVQRESLMKPDVERPTVVRVIDGVEYEVVWPK